VAKIRIYEEGKGGVRLQETEGDANATIKETKVTLEREVAELRQQLEAEEPEEAPVDKELLKAQKAFDKAQEKKSRQLELTPKEKATLDAGRPTEAPKPTAEAKEGAKDANEKVELEIAQKEAVIDVINKTQKLTPSEQLNALNDRLKALADTHDENIPVKTQINRVNKVRKQKPREDMTRPQFYKTMEKVSQEAAKAGVRGIGEAKAVYNKFADENLTWREAEAFDAKLEAALQKDGMTVDKFAAIAEREAQRLMKPKKVVERTIPIKDLSSKKDITHNEYVRAVLREAEKASQGARRATIDKITMTNKDMTKAMDGMSTEGRGKLLKAAMKVGQARNDEARGKALAEFKEKANELVDKEERGVAEKAFDKSVKKANEVLAERTTPKTLRDALGRIVNEKAPPVVIDEKMTVEEAETAREAALIAKSMEGIPRDDMTNEELILTSGRINALIKRSADQQKEIAQYHRTKTSQEVYDQKAAVSIEAPDFHKRADADSTSGSVLEKTGELFNAATAMNLIPHGIARNLDYHHKTGMFQRIQDSFTDSVIKEAHFTTRIMNILDPHEAQFSKINYKRNGDKKAIPTTITKLGVSDRLRIFLGSKDPQTLEAMIESGVSKGTGKGTIPLDQMKIDGIIKQMSAEEKEAGDAILRALRVSGEMVTERSMAEEEYDMAPNKNYAGQLIRIGTDAEAKAGSGDVDIKIDIESGLGLNEAFHQSRLENSGQFKSRGKSKKPVLLYNPLQQLRSTMRVNGKYYGYAKELKSANRLMLYGRKNGLREQYHKNGRGEFYDEFENYVKQQNDLSGHHVTKSGRWASNVVSGFMEYTAGALKINPKVQFFQLGSFPLMKSKMSDEAYKVAQKEFGKAFAGTTVPFNKNMERKISEMSKEYPYINMRYKGRMGVAIGDQERSKKQMRGMEGIRHKDAAVIYAGLKGIEHDVSKLNLSPDEARAEIEKRITNTILETQPSQDDPSRIALSRSDSDIARRLTMFMSQRNKLTDMNNSALMPLYETVRRGEPVTVSDVKQAVSDLLPVIKSQLIIGGIQTIAEQVIMEVSDATGLKERKRFDTPEEYAMYLTGELTENTLFAGFGGWGTFASALSSTAQGYDFEPVPTRAILTDLAASASTMSMLADYSEAKYEGEGREWMDENRMLLGEKISKAITPVTMAWKGFNAKAFYRWLVEVPAVLLDMKGIKKRRQDWEDLPDDKRYPIKERSALYRILHPEGADE